MTESIIYIHSTVQALRVEARINDIPVLSIDGPDPVSSFAPAREYIIEGRNSLQLVIEPPHPGARSLPMPRPIASDASVQVRVAEFEDGEMMDFDAGKEFAQIQATPSPMTLGPLVHTAHFTATPIRKWSWLEAPIIDWERSRALLHTFMDIVARLFAERNGEALTELMDPYLRDSADAYPAFTYDSWVKSMKEKHSEVLPGFRPIPFEPRRAIFRAVAGGRMVQPLDIDGLPLIRCVSTTPYRWDTPSYREMPMMIGFHEKRLSILM